jgi:hypothetical protein
MRWIQRTSVIAAMLLAGCMSDTNAPPDDQAEIPNEVVATFRVEGETFRIWITRKSTIQEMIDVLAGRSSSTVPTGPLLAGPGEVDHNLPWNWHMDPQQTVMAEPTDATCSETPSLVEADLQTWLAKGTYCPWAAKLVSVVVGHPS